MAKEMKGVQTESFTTVGRLPLDNKDSLKEKTRIPRTYRIYDIQRKSSFNQVQRPVLGLEKGDPPRETGDLTWRGKKSRTGGSEIEMKSEVNLRVTAWTPGCRSPRLSQS
jgi:hypothetical protein